MINSQECYSGLFHELDYFHIPQMAIMVSASLTVKEALVSLFFFFSALSDFRLTLCVTCCCLVKQDFASDTLHPLYNSILDGQAFGERKLRWRCTVDIITVSQEDPK